MASEGLPDKQTTSAANKDCCPEHITAVTRDCLKVPFPVTTAVPATRTPLPSTELSPSLSMQSKAVSEMTPYWPGGIEHLYTRYLHATQAQSTQRRCLWAKPWMERWVPVQPIETDLIQPHQQAQSTPQDACEPAEAQSASPRHLTARDQMQSSIGPCRLVQHYQP